MIRIRFFGPGELIQRTFRAAHYVGYANCLGCRCGKGCREIDECVHGDPRRQGGRHMPIDQRRALARKLG